VKFVCMVWLGIRPAMRPGLRIASGSNARAARARWRRAGGAGLERRERRGAHGAARTSVAWPGPAGGAQVSAPRRRASGVSAQISPPPQSKKVSAPSASRSAAATPGASEGRSAMRQTAPARRETAPRRARRSRARVRLAVQDFDVGAERARGP
jgi:hypothetical protein